jgi:hypothetical protein
VGILLIIFLLFVFINELKDIHGKFVIGLVISLIVATSTTRFLDGYAGAIVKVALMFAFLWINSMIFDVWWTLR